MAHSPSPNTFCCCDRAMPRQREQRRFVRKTVQLAGILFEAGALTPLASFTTANVSLDGMAFVSRGLNIQVGQSLSVIFHLDDERQTPIQEVIVVKSVQVNGTIGAAFAEPNRYNFHLDFYLTPTSDLI